MFRRIHLVKTGSVGLLALSLLAAVSPSTALSGPQPLPPLPSQAAINQVIANNPGPLYTPLGVPANILNGFSPFDNVGLSIKSNIDTQLSVSYITTAPALTQIAMPLLNAATTILQPTMPTPDDGKPASIVGGLYETTGANYYVVVVVFNGSWGGGAPNGGTKPQSNVQPQTQSQGVISSSSSETIGGVQSANVQPQSSPQPQNNSSPLGGNKVKELRFYYLNNGQLTYNGIKYKGRKLNGMGGQPSQGDSGAVIANSEVCFTVGLDQVCFPPDAGLRDGSVAGIIQQSYNMLSSVYNLGGVSFDLGNPVPDLIGHNYRSQCAAANLAGSACMPNLVVTAVTKPTAGQPIAIFHVSGTNDLPTFDVNGNLLAGGLPPGDYVVLAASASGSQPQHPLTAQRATSPGTSGALFLVNANTSQPNYLIAAQAVEGFGAGDDGSAPQTPAAVKDGMSAGWGW